MKIFWSPSAVRSLQKISSHIALDKPEAARRWMEDVYKKVSRLEKFPNSGRKVPETGRPEIREIFLEITE